MRLINQSIIFFDSYLHEFIKEPGIYCIKIGDIPYNFFRSQNFQSNNGAGPLSFYSPINIETNEMINQKLNILGYSFDDFNSYYGLVYFRVPLVAKNFVINKWGSLISNIIAEYLIRGHISCDSTSRLYYNRLEELLLINENHIDKNNNITFPLECLHKTQEKKHIPNGYIKDLRLPKLLNRWKK